jgi:hypothetical protein
MAAWCNTTEWGTALLRRRRLLLLLLASSLAILMLRRLLRERAAKDCCCSGGGRRRRTATAPGTPTSRAWSLRATRLCMRHRRKDLMLRASIPLRAVSSLRLLSGRQSPGTTAAAAVAADTSGRVSPAERRAVGRTAIVIREQPAGAVYGARYPGRNGLMDRDGARAAVSGRRLVTVAGFPLAVAVGSGSAVQVSVPVLVAPGQVFLVLHGAEAHLVAVSLLFDLAVSVVRRGAATTVGVLAVHAHLEGVPSASSPQQS